MHKYLGFVLSMLCAPSLGAQTQPFSKFHITLGSGLGASSLIEQISASNDLIGVIPKYPLNLADVNIDIIPKIGFQYSFPKLLSIGVTFDYTTQLLKNELLGKRVSYEENKGEFLQKTEFRNLNLSLYVSFNVLKRSVDEFLFIDFAFPVAHSQLLTTYQTETTGPHDEWNNFVGSGTEMYKRNGWALSWQMGMRWVDYFSENWGYSLYFNYQPLTFMPQKMELTLYELNGEELTNTLTTRQRTYNFGNPENDNPQNPNAPTELTEEKYVFRGFVLGFGVNYRF